MKVVGAFHHLSAVLVGIDRRYKVRSGGAIAGIVR